MGRRICSFAAVSAAAVATAIGCAMSPPASLSPEADPSLPGVDAAYDPSPAHGSSGSAPADAGQDAQKDPAPVDATAPHPDASDAAVDAPPPIPKPAQGEVLITEIMYDPFGTQPASEWFELHNVAASARSLSGLALKDGGGRTHVIGAGVTIAPGAYAVFVREKAAAATAKVPSSAVLYEYGAGLPDNAGVLLANGTTGGLSLVYGATTIAQAPYGGWFSQSGGSSIQLKTLTYAAAALQASWCLSFNAWTSGSAKGTPGAAEDCP